MALHREFSGEDNYANKDSFIGRNSYINRNSDEINSPGFRYDQGDVDLIDAAQINVNIYESDEEEQSRSSNSRSPNVTKSLIEQQSKEGVELQKLKGSVVSSKDTPNMNFYQLEEKCLHFRRTSE